MTDNLLLFLFFATGAGLGLFYFGGLWLTVRRVAHANRPKMLLLSSFLFRTAVVLAGVYGMTQLMGMHWERLAVGLLGFLAARFVLVRRWRPESASRSPDPTIAS